MVFMCTHSIAGDDGVQCEYCKHPFVSVHLLSNIHLTLFKSQTEDKALPSTDKTETDAVKDPENVNGQDPERKQSQLQYTYTLWFNRRVQGARTQENYEKNIKKIGSFSTVCIISIYL